MVFLFLWALKAKGWIRDGVLWMAGIILSRGGELDAAPDCIAKHAECRIGLSYGLI